MPKRTAILDGDSSIYESAYRAEERISFGDGIEGSSYDPEHAIANFNTRIRSIQEACEADAIIICLSDPARRYFRHDLLPTYKQSRTTHERPKAMDAVRRHAEENYETKWMPRLEADDVVGILATGSGVKGERVVVSSDKDLRQIPGLHLNPMKMAEGSYEVTLAEGDYFHFFQTLTGDTCDNYKGCPKIGPVKAERLLTQAILEASVGDRDWMVTAWAWVVAAYAAKGLTEQDALIQARVAKILRAEDWDKKNKEPRLWNPPT